MSNQAKFRLSKIIKIKYYFNAEIQERKMMSRYISEFDYFHDSLIVLNAASGEISIIYFSRIIGFPVGIARAIFKSCILLN